MKLNILVHNFSGAIRVFDLDNKLVPYEVNLSNYYEGAAFTNLWTFYHLKDQ